MAKLEVDVNRGIVRHTILRVTIDPPKCPGSSPASDRDVFIVTCSRCDYTATLQLLTRSV